MSWLLWFLVGIFIFLVLFLALWVWLHTWGQFKGVAILHIQNNVAKAVGEMLLTDSNTDGSTDLILPDTMLDKSGLNIRLGALSFSKSISMSIDAHMKQKYEDFAKDDPAMPRYFFHGSKDNFDTLKLNTIMLATIKNLFHSTMYATMMTLPHRVGFMKPFWYAPPKMKIPCPSFRIKDDLAPLKDFRGERTSDGRVVLGFVHVFHMESASFWQGGRSQRVCEFDAKGDGRALGPAKADGGIPAGKICVRKCGSSCEWMHEAFNVFKDAPEDAWIMAPDVLQAADMKIVHHYRVVGPRDPSAAGAPLTKPLLP